MKQVGVVIFENPTLLVRGGKACVVGYDVCKYLENWLGVKSKLENVGQGSSPLFRTVGTVFDLADVDVDIGYDGEIMLIRSPRFVKLKRKKRGEVKVTLATNIKVIVKEENGELQEITNMQEQCLKPGEMGYIVEKDVETDEIVVDANHNWSYENKENETKLHEAVKEFARNLFRR